MVRLVPVKTQLALRRGGFLKSQAVLTVDIHLLLWWASMPEQLPQPSRSRLASCECRPFFSLVSLWEVAIKASLGRTNFQVNPSALRMGLLREGYQELPLQSERVLAVQHLPWVPFS